MALVSRIYSQGCAASPNKQRRRLGAAVSVPEELVVLRDENRAATKARELDYRTDIGVSSPLPEPISRRAQVPLRPSAMIHGRIAYANGPDGIERGALTGRPHVGVDPGFSEQFKAACAPRPNPNAWWRKKGRYAD